MLLPDTAIVMGVSGEGKFRGAWDLISRNMPALRRLSREQKSLDQLALAANCHTGESLVPQTLGHLGLAVKPLRQQF